MTTKIGANGARIIYARLQLTMLLLKKQSRPHIYFIGRVSQSAVTLLTAYRGIVHACYNIQETGCVQEMIQDRSSDSCFNCFLDVCRPLLEFYWGVEPECLACYTCVSISPSLVERRMSVCVNHLAWSTSHVGVMFGLDIGYGLISDRA